MLTNGASRSYQRLSYSFAITSVFTLDLVYVNDHECNGESKEHVVGYRCYLAFYVCNFYLLIFVYVSRGCNVVSRIFALASCRQL